MTVKDLTHISHIIFGSDGQQVATRTHPQQRALQRFERVAWEFVTQANSADAIFTNNAAPQGVVEINHNAFARCPPTRHQVSSQRARDRDIPGRRKRLTRHQVHPMIEQAVQANVDRNTRDVKN